MTIAEAIVKLQALAKTKPDIPLVIMVYSAGKSPYTGDSMPIEDIVYGDWYGPGELCGIVLAIYSIPGGS